tara:strand:- start:13082 stop:13558 length:477 start_codon:yes stop_codon:yes gene_type:complete
MKSRREQLGLLAHPEGGAFRELYKSTSKVSPADERSQRCALTHIYFELAGKEVSRFHRVASDEIWHLYEGEGVALYQWTEGSDTIERIELGGVDRPHCHLIPAGVWQAAAPLGDTVLVGCTVAPGFEFEDFLLIDPTGDTAESIRSIDPELERFITGI